MWDIDASFIGDGRDGLAGRRVAYAGDVNGDGFDDILIGAPYNNQVDTWAGKAYLMFGKESGWTKNFNLANADASFLGEAYQDGAGTDVACAGDVNGDGFSDFLISAHRNSESHWWAGQVYLFFGKPSGWGRNTPINKADASFLGEVEYDMVGREVAGAGDLNGDGYDDIVIEDYFNTQPGKIEAGRFFIIFGRASNWSIDTPITDADAWYLGEAAYDHLSSDVEIVGDVNNDGLDDILVGAGWNDENGTDKGQTYLIFGRASGWSKNALITDVANASFIGEFDSDMAGHQVGKAGDVNNDGYDDFLIFCDNNNIYGNLSGKIHLILGKADGWAMDVNLSTAEASFYGEYADDHAGWAMGGAGDVNADGYDDFLIGSDFNDEGGGSPSTWNDGAGQAYLIMGRDKGWSKNVNLSNTNASFIGKSAWDNLGSSVACDGDANGDGYDDILIGAPYSNAGGFQVGETYLIFQGINDGPVIIDTVKAHSDPLRNNEADLVGMDNLVYVEVSAQDVNKSMADWTFVQVTSNESSPEGFRLKLRESGPNTGKYQGFFCIGDVTTANRNMINATVGEQINITSTVDPSKSTFVRINEPVYIKPLKDNLYAVEDEPYFMHYYNFGYSKVSYWNCETNASWLSWDDTNHDLTGIPDNSDVGTSWVHLSITDGQGGFDDHNFTIKIQNTPPVITTAYKSIALEDEQYFVDYNCSDDGLGAMTWYLYTNATWLGINSSSGVVTGTPVDDEKGRYWVNVTAEDDHGGRGWSNYSLAVMDTNR
jgi:hypothetical protein